MERFTISMGSEDIDLFERRRTDLGFSKSAFVRYLIAVNENCVPQFIQHKEIIRQMAEINTHLHEILINDNFDTVNKIHLYEKIETLNASIKLLIDNCANLAQTDKEKK